MRETPTATAIPADLQRLLQRQSEQAAADLLVTLRTKEGFFLTEIEPDLATQLAPRFQFVYELIERSLRADLRRQLQGERAAAVVTALSKQRKTTRDRLPEIADQVLAALDAKMDQYRPDQLLQFNVRKLVHDVVETALAAFLNQYDEAFPMDPNGLPMQGAD